MIGAALRYVYSASAGDPCKTCKGRCKLPAKGKPVWSIETKAGKPKQPYIFFDWDCPNGLQYAPAAFLVELWRQREAGMPLPELSAQGARAFQIIHETIMFHRRLIYGG